MIHCRIEIIAIIIPILVFLMLIVLYYFTVEHRKQGNYDFLFMENGGKCNNKNIYRACNPKPCEENFICFDQNYKYTRTRVLLAMIFGILFLFALIFLLYNIYTMYFNCRAPGYIVAEKPKTKKYRRQMVAFGGSGDPYTNCDFYESEPFEPILGVVSMPSSTI